MLRSTLVASGAVCALLATAACSGGASSDSPVADDAGSEEARRPQLPTDDDSGVVPPTGPMLLSETGLYSDFAARTLSPALFAYAPRYEFWVDGGKKTRFLYLPPGTKIDTSNIDSFVFPVGTKAFKELRYDGKLIETRLLMKVREGTGNGAWWEVAYVWKADGSDAVATPLGQDNALGTTHRIPKQTDCGNCHGGVSDVLIGVSAIQLSDPANNALMQLSAAGRLTNSVPAAIEPPGTGVVKDALAYLHANCGHCHNDGSVRVDNQSKMRLRLLVAQTTPEVTGAYTTTIGTVMKHTLPDGTTDVVVKGNPDKSGLWLRMNRRDNFGMPPAGTQTIDTAGVDIVRQWLLAWQ